jgi:hypothetical protein
MSGGTKEYSRTLPASPRSLSNYPILSSPPLPELWLLKTRRWLPRVAVASALMVRRVAGEQKGEGKLILVLVLLLGFLVAGSGLC